MSQDNTIIEDMKHAMDNLPDDVREQLLGGEEPPAVSYTHLRAHETR